MGLDIQLEPAEPAAELWLQQRVAAELRARDLDVCAPGERQEQLARVYVAAPMPQLSPTRVSVHTGAGAARERKLDMAELPVEARVSAIASATDELLSALLQSAPAATANTQGGQASDSPEPGDVGAGGARPEQAWRLPWLELGLGGGAARFRRQGESQSVEALARFRPLPRLSATVRAGAQRGEADGRLISSIDVSFDDIPERTSGWRLGLDAGFELLEPAEGFGLSAQGGLSLARLQRRVEWEVATPVGTGRQLVPSDRTWEVAANAGAELSYRAGALGVALGLTALLPLSAKPLPPDPVPVPQAIDGAQQWDAASAPLVPASRGFGEQLGGELGVRVWVAIGS